eukprot:jgi/Mesen1/5654/ME000286S04865
MAEGSSSRKGRQRRRVQWNEENLDYLEQTKTPKQKINEPKTPFHQLSLDPEEAGELTPTHLPDESDFDVAQAKGDAAHAEAIATALSDYAAAGSPQHSGGPEIARTTSNGWTSSEDEIGNDVDLEDFEKFVGQRPGFKQSLSFKEHRRRHYDEYRKLKQLGPKIVDMVLLEDEDGSSRANGRKVPRVAEDNGNGAQA